MLFLFLVSYQFRILFLSSCLCRFRFCFRVRFVVVLVFVFDFRSHIEAEGDSKFRCRCRRGRARSPFPTLPRWPPGGGSRGRVAGEGSRGVLGGRKLGRGVGNRIFSIFLAFKKTLKKRIAKKLLFWCFFSILARSGIDFQPFLVPKEIPRGHVSVIFSKTAILSKSCAHCGNNIILKGRTLQKSVGGVTPHGTGKKKR